MPWNSLASWIEHCGWLQDAVHWMSQWVSFCPFLTLATARNHEEKDEARANFLTKFLLSMTIQITVGVISVIGGSYLTLQIVSYRMEKAEQAIEAIRVRQFRNEDRITVTERDLAVIAERKRIEEMQQHKAN